MPNLLPAAKQYRLAFLRFKALGFILEPARILTSKSRRANTI